MICIIMTPTQAAQIRGTTAPGYALNPILIPSGEYVLPASVLDDPAHALRRDVLLVLPQREVAGDEFPPPISRQQPASRQ